ncbi:replicative DNA helicase [Dactylosporangium sp. CA-092794]|uniref:replicative DNA helicase n=1 Tax=Dactylosporangium sp. CA-092794 TaxID=3239929 RepID=UPI003D89D14F
MSVTDDRRTDPWEGATPAEPRGGPDAGGGGAPSGGGGSFERTPPQDVAAEQSVLGGMLLSKDAIADVVEILKTHDFYKPSHSVIFDAILDLYGRGEPADAVTVAATLTDAGQIAKIGGAPYLHTLMTTVPTAANASYYARIVAERAVLRRVIEAGTRIVQLGYGAGGPGGRDVDDVVDLAQQAIYDVTEKRVSEDFAVLAEMLQPTLDEIEAVGAQGGMMTGVPTGFSDLDRLLNGLHAGQLIIVAGRPGLGKSTAAMDFSRAASVKHNMASAIFSLEMSKVEIVMRLLSAEARVPLHVLRSGQLSDDDWTKLARRMGEISEAPLFVDDTPNMNLMEIRAKARRLKQRHDLKLIVVDYLQLMTSPKRTESRQQEVADLSRGLKLLAKEVECPVVAVSQLNRGPEQRTDKRPQLSDLRESGCLTAGTRIMRADTNAETTIGEILRSGARDIPVWALNEKLQYVSRTMTHAFSSGRKEVYRMRLTSGKTIEATANHPFLTFTGWVPLGDLAVGGRVAVPRHVPPPLEIQPWPEPEVVLLAHLLGDGSFVRRQPIRYASVDEANLEAVSEAARHFGITAVRDDYAAARVTSLRLPAPFRLARGRRDPIAAWLDGLGLFGLRSHEKFLPEALFSLPKDQVRLFLRHLWATDGSVTTRTDGGSGRICFASTSQAMLNGISRLLLRFGVTARIRAVTPGVYRPQWTLDVSGRDDQLRFLREIGVYGARGAACERLRARLEVTQSNTNVDTVPKEVWGSVRSILLDQGISHREFASATGTRFGGSSMWKRAPSRPRLARIAAVLDSADLDLHATNDVFWDEIRSIESLGEQEVYDATVPGAHNFVANGIATHNSIEQDADVVILLHRDDYYDKESPRAGEADFIVAKHRNGPTDTITVAAQLHLSRFVDMAI